MATRISRVSFCAALAAAVCTQTATAQVGTLSRAIGHAFAKEAQILQQAQDKPAQDNASASVKHPVQTSQPPTAKRPVADGKVMRIQLGTGDALANVAATTCHQANGTTIRVSGGYRPAASDSGECR
jgi:hypothetical protein